MCRKPPEQCKAKVKCKCCKEKLTYPPEISGDTFMSNFNSLEVCKSGGLIRRELFVLCAGSGQKVHTYNCDKIQVDKEQKDANLTLNQVDNLNEQQDFIIDIGGE